MARIQIRIIFQGHFIRILQYSNIRAHHCVDNDDNFIEDFDNVSGDNCDKDAENDEDQHNKGAENYNRLQIQR